MGAAPRHYLVDTNVISALAPTKHEPAPGLVDWLDRHTAQLCLSAVTIAEITAGLAKLRRQGAATRAERLDAWLTLVLHLYGNRVLPLDVAAARATGELAELARSQGHAPGFADLAIAGTARAHGLTLLTRNVRHFRMLPVAVVDPFADLPEPDGEPPAMC